MLPGKVERKKHNAIFGDLKCFKCMEQVHCLKVKFMVFFSLSGLITCNYLDYQVVAASLH